jgi:multidrug resistance protein MdtO
MPALSERTAASSSGFFTWLSYELAPKEGRARSVALMATACVITVAIAMVFRIPEPTYMAYIVFLISRDEKASTFVSALGGQAAVTLGIAVSLGLCLIDLSEPAVRLPAVAAVTFLGMYSVRVFALGPITYLAGFVIVLLQSVVDQVPSPEALTRISLWVWVVLLVPIVTTVILNILFSPDVGVLRNREFVRIVGGLARGLRIADPAIPLDRYRERVVELLDKKTPDSTAPAGRAAVTAAVLKQLLNLLVLLEAADAQELLLHGPRWAARLETIQARVGQMMESLAPAAPVSEGPLAAAIEATLSDIERALEEPAPAAAAKPAGEHHLIVKDATTNPAHWQFALKTTFAVMIVYAIYTLLNWPGLRTSIVTCFFVALGSLGETVHKLTLRIAGALIGGLVAGLSIVFVLPHLTDIGQLSVLIAVISAVAAWIATSSERLAYAGLQMAFAFFLGVLQDYGPATDLTVLRDRVVGILLGNVVITVVFSTLWPQSAAARVRSAIAEVLRALGSLLDAPAGDAANRERAARSLVVAERFRTLRGFELQMMPGHAPLESIVHSLRSLATLAGWTFTLREPSGSPGYPDEDRQALTHWAADAAKNVDAGTHWPAAPSLLPGASPSVQKVLGAACVASGLALEDERR